VAGGLTLVAVGMTIGVTVWIARRTAPDNKAAPEGARAFAGERLSKTPEFQKLIADLSAGNVETRATAARTLGTMGADARPAVPALLAALPGAPAPVRQAVAGALDQIGPPDAGDAPTLVDALRGTDRTARAYAARVWSTQAAPHEALPLLAAALADRDAGLRQAAAVALGKFGPDGKSVALAPLIAALGDADDAVSRAAREALAMLGPCTRADLNTLRAALRAGSAAASRLFAAEALAGLRLSPAEAVPLWRSLLSDEGEDVCARAADELAALGRSAAPARSALSDRLTHPSPRVRRAAVRALAASGPDPSALTALAERLGDDDPAVRNEAVEAVTALKPGGKDDLPVLSRMLRCENARARAAAAAALARLGPDAKPAVPDLAAALRDRDPSVRVSVLQALAAVGPDAEPALPALVALLHEGDAPDAPGDADGPAGQSIASRLLKSTVWVCTRGKSPPSYGGGVLVDAGEKLVLTNYQTIHAAPEVVVYFPVYDNGTLLTRPADYAGAAARGMQYGKGVRVVSWDRLIDLALLSLADRLPDGVRPIRVAPESAPPGTDVHALGAEGVDGQTFEGNLWRYARGKLRQVSPVEQRAVTRTGRRAAALNSVDRGSPVVNDRCELLGLRATSSSPPLIDYTIDSREVRTFLAAAYKSLGKKPANMPAEGGAPAEPEPVDVGKAVVATIARLGPPAVPVLAKELKDSSSRPVRAEILAALGGFGEAAAPAAPELVSLLADVEIQEKVSDVLGRIGVAAVPALVKGLNDPKPAVRLGAVVTLGRLGAAAKSAEQQLEDRSKYDKAREVRKAAQEALRKIRQ
jgi:HEAT repeat protein